ncbi:hypothetical protein [Moorena sp. SIO1G6]|nr:hypothetical protein [Moorena sp. SIO1G6]
MSVSVHNFKQETDGDYVEFWTTDQNGFVDAAFSFIAFGDAKSQP